MENIENIKILKAEDLKDLLHIGKDRAYALMRAKSFPSTKIGKTYFVTENNFRDWLNQNAGRNITL